MRLSSLLCLQVALAVSGAGQSGPSISLQPQGKAVTSPTTATFSVTASGNTPLSYQWNKNGAPIRSATSASYTTPPTAWGTNGASFTVTVSNSFASVTSTPAILTVYPTPVANLSPAGPVLIGGQPRDQTVLTGASATFTATAIGAAPITYQWNRNGTPIPGASSATYTTPPTTSADNGATFTVTVANSVNAFTSLPATLSVTSVPVVPTITMPPQYISVSQGNTASFYVVATATAPLSYQWINNGTPIDDATDPGYTTPPTTSADNGSVFSVTVSNSAGSITSAPPNPSSPANLVVTSQVHGLGGFYPLYPDNPDDLTAVQYRFQVVTNQSQALRIIFNHNTLNTPGSPVNDYEIESNVYSGTYIFANGGCTTWPMLGTYIEGEASLRNATADYEYQRGQEPAVGSSISTSNAINWPIQTYLVDGIPNLWKSDSISQHSINGIEALVTIQRGGTLTDVSSFMRCGLSMLPGTYRMWIVTTQIAGRSAVVNQVVVPEAYTRYLIPAYAMQFSSELQNQPGVFSAQFWDFAYMRESRPAWTAVTTFTTMYPYDGTGQDFGVHVVSVDGQDRVEFSNASGNSYLPGNLPFSMAPPRRGRCRYRPDCIVEPSHPDHPRAAHDSWQLP